MKKLLTLILLAVTISAGAQEINISSTLGNIPKRISLNEMTTTTYSIDDTCRIVMTNGANYDIHTNDISSEAVTSRETCLNSGKYADMKFVREFSSLDELNVGDIIGIIDTLDYSVYDYINNVYGNLYGLESVLVPALNANAALLCARNLIPYTSLRIHAVNLAYVSTDTKGKKLALTERIIYPYSTSSRKLTLSKIHIDNHYTVTADSMAPSNFFWSTLLNGWVTKGYMFVSPDYQGYGISSDRSQLYLDVDNNPRNAADGLIAAKYYAEMSMSGDGYIPVNLSDTATIINTGMSQGAGNAMALTYYMENCLDEYRASKLPKITYTNICAGAIDLKLSIDECFATDTLHYPALLPLILSTAVVGHPEIMQDASGNKFRVHDYFVPELETKTWDTSEYGLPGKNTLWQTIYSKKVTTVPIGNGLVESYGCPDGMMFGAVLIHKIMRDDVIVPNLPGGYMLNPVNKYANAIIRFAERNNLCDPARWVPKSDIYMVHDSKDELVPYANTLEFKTNMSSLMEKNGHRLTVETIENSGLMHFYFCMAWMTSQLTGLPINAVIALMKS